MGQSHTVDRIELFGRPAVKAPLTAPLWLSPSYWRAVDGDLRTRDNTHLPSMACSCAILSVPNAPEPPSPEEPHERPKKAPTRRVRTGRQGLPRAPPAQEGRSRLGVARGARRGVRDLRGLLGMEPRARQGRVRRATHRLRPDGPHVHLHGVRPRRDVLVDAGRRSRLRVRPPSPRAARRLCHRDRRPHRVRRRTRRDLDVHRAGTCSRSDSSRASIRGPSCWPAT